RHEIDRSGRRHLRGNDDVALVLTALVVDEDEHAAVARVLDDVLDRRDDLDETHARSFPRRRATYRASRSISRLMRSPVRARPNVVLACVWGMMLTPKRRPSTSLTVSDTPSSATDPLGATTRS